MEVKFFYIGTCLMFLIICTDTVLCEKINSDQVLVVILARNRNHVLPYFLHYFENIYYPKNKMSLFIRSDHNIDGTISGLRSWLDKNEHKYLSVDSDFQEDPNTYEEEDERRLTIMKHKQDGFKKAHETNANFVWFLDVDTFHTNPNVLQTLIKQNKTIISPMLTSITSYRNFWADMTDTYKCQLSEVYNNIATNKIKGCFPVALVSESVLINLSQENSNYLSFLNESDISNPHINVNVFLSLTSKENNIERYVCNDDQYGSVLLPSTWPVNVEDELNQLKKLNLSITVERKNIFSYDKLYCINLKRRPERRENMQKNFDKLGLQATFFDAIDWKDFNETYLKSLDIRVLKNYDKGDVTLGVIANFLSHYFIWQDISSNRYEKAIILEDDVNFHHDFLEQMDQLMKDVQKLQLEWDLIFLGRRRMEDESNNEVPGSNILVKPDFSWWLIGYLLSHEGAKKLVDQEPLQKIIPADEYVPIMYDKHSEEKYKKHFNPRNMNAFAVNPSIISPTHYKKDEGYVSDTSWAPEVSDTTVENVLVQIKQDLHAEKIEL